MSHFVQVHIETRLSDLVRIDLQAAVQRSIHTLHLPGKTLHDDQVKMKIFVPQGVTCFSGTTLDCTSPFENWQAVLMAEGRRAYPGRNPDTMVFHRVHKAIEDSPTLPPSTSFLLTLMNRTAHEQLFSRSSRQGLSSLAHVIGPLSPRCGTYWTCVEARKDGLSTTTTSGFDITRFRFIKVISLPVMSDVTVPPLSRRIAR